MKTQKSIFFKFKKEDESTLPVFRSSALFYFCVSESNDTELHFLNYWRLKRDINGLTFSIKCYDMLGRSLFVEENINIFNGANLISLRTLLANKLGEDYPSEGSFEFEILSSENLFISYPAAVVRYKGPNWHTLAHTTQRIYSKSSGDDTDLLSSSFLAEEGNQTIPSETYFEPFFIIHNGPTDLIDDDMEIEIQSINQRKQLFKVPTMNWLRRETKIFWLKDLCDYRSVTKNKIGTFTVKFRVKGVFPRIIAGIADTRTGAWSIDHTNFAAKSGPAIDDVFQIAPGSQDNLVFVMPNILENGWNSYADIYPTGASDKFSVIVGEGENRRSINLEKNTKRLMQRVQLGSGKSTLFSFQNDDGKLPRRFHMGLHYQYCDGPPGFLIDGPLPATTKPTSTRWCPIFSEQGQENYILMADRSLGGEGPTGFTAEVAFYNPHDEKPMLRSFRVNPKDTVVFNIEGDRELKKFISSGPAWAFMKFQPACYAVVHYISRFGSSVAACHAF